jgi:hypothetical protein
VEALKRDGHLLESPPERQRIVFALAAFFFWMAEESIGVHMAAITQAALCPVA